ncbi:MAG: hypothetical protein K2X10_14825 [Hyphomicrobiales bacterium]|nr:hypothetical protein [Hyphomicrobiales bacterium]
MTEKSSDISIFEKKLLNDIVKIRKEINEKELVVVEYLLDMIMVELLEISNKTAHK